MTMKRAFHLVYTVLALNFILPTMVYIFDPTTAVGQFAGLSEMFGVQYVHSEDSMFWRVLAIANVATLGFCCVLLQVDLKKWFPVLTPLVFLKSMASAGFGIAFLFEPMPTYLAAFLFDGVTVLAMLFFAIAAKRELDGGEPGLHNVVLRHPERVKDKLERLTKSGVERVPTLWQVALGALYMRHRVIFRSATIGTGETPIRATLRARLLSYRVLRFPFLVWEQVISPFELTGLASSPEFLERHLLGAFHPLDHGMYDLHILSLYPGRLEGLRERASGVASGQTLRGLWLQDLCVHEGYHSTLVRLIDRAMAGDFRPEDLEVPADTCLEGYLAWCVAQPKTPRETWQAWRAGHFSLSPRPSLATL